VSHVSLEIPGILKEIKARSIHVSTLTRFCARATRSEVWGVDVATKLLYVEPG